MNGPPIDVRHPSTASGVGTRDHAERKCTVWVHEEQFSREEVLLNLDLFPKNAVKPGDLMAIIGLKTDTAACDFQDRSTSSKKALDNIAVSFQLNPKFLETEFNNGGARNAMHDADLEKRYLFTVSDMSKELKARQPSLEVSVAKHIADVFGFKHRTEVLLTTVSLL
jgi:DEP domain-containing protein 5